MVGRDLRIRRFTPLAEKVFNLIPTDVGRPISDIKPRIVVPELGRAIRDVVQTLAPADLEVRDPTAAGTTCGSAPTRRSRTASRARCSR